MCELYTGSRKTSDPCRNRMTNIYSRLMRKGGLLLLALITFVCALVYACSLTLKYQRQSFETEARNTATIVRSAMNVVDGVATSLRALQGTRSDQSQSDSYARTVMGDYPFVSGFGRFEKISADQFASFSVNKQHRAEPFSVWWYDQDGNRVTNGVNNQLGAAADQSVQYFPVTLMKSQANAGQKEAETTEQKGAHELINPSLMGFNLGSLDAVQSAIVQARDSGKTALVKTPNHWPGGPSILAIRATYLNQDLPTTFKDRREQIDGGYWIEFDIGGLAKMDDSFNAMGLKLNLIEEASEYSMTSLGSETIYHRVAAKTDYILADWFAPHEWLTTFTVGDQTFTVVLSRERGLTGKSLVASVLSTTLFLALAFLIVNLNNKRRRAQRFQKLQSERLYQEQHRAAVTLSSIGDGVLTIGVDQTVQYNNGAAEKLLDINKGQIIGVPVHSVIRLMDDNGDLLLTHGKNDSEFFGSDEVVSREQNLVRLDGTSMAVNLTVSPLLDISGERSGSVIVLRDVSAEKELRTRLEHQVNHDSLTGLANRFQFERSLERLFEVMPEDSEHALCFIDLDRFKQINDTCGHAAGDELLVQLSTALKGKIRAEDLLARLGGDEFAVILKNCDIDSADTVANRIHRFFKTFHFEYEGRVFPVRSSIGLVPFRPSSARMSSVVSAADAACYVAKKNGRNSVHCHTVEDAQLAGIGNEELWMPRIQEALEQDKFCLYVQPVCASAGCYSGDATHHEVLVRMLDDQQKLIYPVEFIKPAERYDLMTDIDRWVIGNALQKIAQLPVPLRDDTFSINLSAASVNDAQLIDFIRRSITLTGVKASQLCFEIDEDVVLNNLESAQRLINALKKMECSVALDDFGAGVSSLSALSELSVKYLKIDGQFVTNIVHSSVDESMVRSIHCFAKSMGLQTIAEKVETGAALEMLESIGVDYAQGFVIAKPVLLEDYRSRRLAA